MQVRAGELTYLKQAHPCFKYYEDILVRDPLPQKENFTNCFIYKYITATFIISPATIEWSRLTGGVHIPPDKEKGKKAKKTLTNLHERQVLVDYREHKTCSKASRAKK